MELYYPDSNRLGKFNITYETLLNDRPMCAALFALGVVIYTERHESGRGIIYYAASEAFDELTDKEEIPEYRIEFVYDRPFENPEWEARRVASGKFGFAFFRNTIVRVPALELGVKAARPSLH